MYMDTDFSALKQLGIGRVLYRLAPVPLEGTAIRSISWDPRFIYLVVKSRAFS